MGLDIVEQLEKDLKTLERRNSMKALPPEQLVETGNIESVIEKHKEEIEALSQEAARLRAYQIDPKHARLSELDEIFRKAGGELYERKGEIEDAVRVQQEKLNACENTLRVLAEGHLPFSLVQDLLDSLKQRDKKEFEAIQAKKDISNLEDIKSSLLEFLNSKKSDKATTKLAGTYLGYEIKRKRKALNAAISNPLDEHTRQNLLSLLKTELDEAQAQARKVCEIHENLQRLSDEANSEWSSIPKPDDVKSIIDERNRVEKELHECEKALAEIQLKIEAGQKQVDIHEKMLQSMLDEAKSMQVQIDEQGRMLTHSAKARETLDSFKDHVIRRHIDNIQALVLENYQILLRKDSLIERVVIDPESFHVQLFNKEGQAFATDRLSAGERQLLAISLLWAMAKASGRPLPAAIDTPLGRLDATHRKFLVQRYFPRASHQVFLFSTDQEVHGVFLEDLKSKVGRNYHLQYDDKKGSTSITRGYLQ